MFGVSRITGADDVMLISYVDAEPLFMTKTLNALADAGVVVDMISQSAPYGGSIRFSFTAPNADLGSAMKALGGDDKPYAPMISGGYAKINLFGEEMVDSVGVAAQALAALNTGKIDISLITTSDLDISLLVRQEDVDVAVQLLRDAYKI